MGMDLAVALAVLTIRLTAARTWLLFLRLALPFTTLASALPAALRFWIAAPNAASSAAPGFLEGAALGAVVFLVVAIICLALSLCYSLPLQAEAFAEPVVIAHPLPQNFPSARRQVTVGHQRQSLPKRGIDS